jgi:hypothetical protein
MPNKAKKVIAFLLFNIIFVCVAFMLIEGLSSLILFYQATRQTRVLAERLHTEYDAELGWVSSPNIYVENMYGPGVYLKTNGQSFRNEADFSVEIPAGQVRAICSGDSFTLGYGVDNTQTWCQLLMELDERLQTVNMGQGGYGVDQAYLWYKRDGTKLDHDIQLFAFITTDFIRMERDQFRGYGKPLLQIHADQLVVDNVPVPRRAFYIPWLTRNREALDDLRSVQLLQTMFFAEPTAEPSTTPPTASNEQAPEFIAAKMLEDLQRLNLEKGSVLVLVYLPEQRDYEPRPETERWRENVKIAAERSGIAYIDLIEEFRQLSPDGIASLFIAPGALDFPDAAGHYTVKGNIYISGILHKKLLALPAVSARLAAETVEN